MKKESGQVLISGVIMITLLLLAILYTFDVHNVIRAKLKIETGLQSAALTGATWQRNSLNLIGEINLFKACSALLEGENHWQTPLPQAPANPVTEDEKIQAERRRKALQGRIDLLTEMQTRIAFIGPLIGFAAAQQAAKANGLPAASSQAINNYLSRVSTSYRYSSEFGGADDVINNYRWREPYIALLREVGTRGLAVYPNVRTARGPVVNPPELAQEDFYTRIHLHAREISSGNPPKNQSTWHDAVYRFAKNHHEWTQSVLNRKWWDIDFTLNKFPDESEIFTLGVRNGFSNQSGFTTYNDHQYKIGSHLTAALEKAPADVKDSIYKTMQDLPDNVNMKWFCYDESWYPEYYRSVEKDYDQYHYNYWFGKQVLRKKVKPQYRYEGPAAYTESCDVFLNRMIRQRVNRNKRGSVLYKTGAASIQVGPKHESQAADESYSTDYRPGSIAKTLGELDGNNLPIAIPLVMPVFSKVAIMPTYMPIPYGFGVLRAYESKLDEFLNWLAAETSLRSSKNPLPGGCEDYLEALKSLIDRKNFLNYGYNPDCNVKLTPAMLEKWEKIRSKYLYCKSNRKGLGWLQEPKLCLDVFNKTPPRDLIVETRDFINGGMAKRIYTSFDSMNYYVIDSKGRVVTNDDPDPTIKFGSDYCNGSCNCGKCFGTHNNAPDLDKGPVRL